MFKLWCEYDYGQDGVIFVTKLDAEHFLQKRIDEQEDDWTAKELFDDGLADVEKVEIYERD